MSIALENRVDSIFSVWSEGLCPGGQVVVRKEGQLIYSKNFGYANLEHQLPVKDDTVFHVASVSKQVTVMCVLLLQEEGKLNIEDDVREYLPDLIKFQEPVTLRNMMNNVSGIRDQWESLMISGTRIDDTITQQDALTMIASQEELNFEPKSQYMYSNSNFTLLVEIIERVSGKTLNEYATQKIFTPLGMGQTIFKDSYWRLINNRASSYNDTGTGEFVVNVLNYGTYGATALNTTATDFLKWMENYKEPTICTKETLNIMFKAPKLLDGKDSSYAGGLQVGEYKGHKYIEHGGADAAYRAQILRFTDDDVDIVIFSNTQNIAVRDAAFSIADLVFDIPNEESNEERPNCYNGDYDIIKSEGFYFGLTQDLSPLAFTISLRDGKPCRIGGYVDAPLIHVSGNHFRMKNMNADLYLGDEGCIKIKTIIIPLRQLSPYKLISDNDSKYLGRFESRELGIYYDIIEEDGLLYFNHRRNGKNLLYKISEDKFATGGPMTHTMEFIKDIESIKGFKLSGGRVRNIRFEKI